MALNADTLLDRIHLKRTASRWRLFAIVAVAALILVVFAKGGRFSPIYSDYIARISVEDTITDSRDLSKLIKSAGEDKHIRAVLVWLNTPGGSAVGGQQLYLDLRALSAKKPVVAVMRSTAASAGYMAALGADRIVAREGTVTGSIGVIMEAFEATELAAKLGIKPITLKSGVNKAAPNPLEKFTLGQEAVIQGIIQDFYNWFVDIVAERRHLPRETVEALADGRIFTGRQALKTNLIDELGGEDEAVQWLEKTKKIPSSLEISDVKLDKESLSWLDLITQMAKGKIGALMPQRLDGLSAIWQPNAL